MLVAHSVCCPDALAHLDCSELDLTIGLAHDRQCLDPLEHTHGLYPWAQMLSSVHSLFSSLRDDEVDETAEGADEETIEAIFAGKKKERDAMEAFGSFVCEEWPKDAKIIATRRENVPKGHKRRCRFVASKFRHDDPEMEGLYTSGGCVATGRLVDMHAVRHG